MQTLSGASLPRSPKVTREHVLKIHVLGGLYVTSDDRPLTGTANQPRLLALLALLAVAGERGITHDTLLAYLWPEADPEQGRILLAQALNALRRDLGSDEAFLGMKDLRLNADMVGCDVADFRDAASTGDLERAVEAWRGPFLDGFRLPGAPVFERWVEDQRAALQFDYATLLEQLADQAHGRNDPRSEAGWLRKLAATDPANGQLAARLVRALADLGDVKGALRHAQAHEGLVREGLGQTPAPEVLALAMELRGRSGTSSTARSADPAGVAPPVSAASDQAAPARDRPGLARVSAPGPVVAAPRESDTGPRLAVRVAGILVLGIIILAGYLILRGLISALRGAR